MKETPKCPICGKECKVSKLGLVRKTCGSPECIKELRMKAVNPMNTPEAMAKRKATNLKKYGCENPSQSQEVKDKKKRTLIEHYGVDHQMKSSAVREKAKQSFLNRYGVDHPLKSEEVKERTKETNRKRYGCDWSLQSGEVREKGKRTNIGKFGVENPFQSEEVKEKIRQKNLKLYGVENPAQRPEVQEKMKATCSERYGVDNVFRTDDFKNEMRRRNLETYGVEYFTQTKEMKEKSKATNLERRGVEHSSQDPEVLRKIFAHRRARKDGFDSMSEKKLAEMLTRRKVEFETHYHVNGHEFDFAVFKKGELKCLIEVDGEYNHGLLSDPDGKLVQGEKDCGRFGKVPEGVNFVVVDSSKVTEENIAEIMKSVDLDYESFIRKLMDGLPKEFPYPSYDEKRMRTDWEHLREYKVTPKHRIGQSIVSNFHKTIWKSHVGSNPSPVEAWSNPELLEKCVRNRFIYKSVLSSQNIAQGFNVCKLAPKVSVFNPSLAKYILSKYAPTAKTVIDPFSGFSGRLLGACSLGMEYLGYDANKEAVAESNEIIRFLGLNGKVENRNVFDNSGSADVLFTCPPYGSKESWVKGEIIQSCERWITECLNRFNCGKYIFVVDDSCGRYKDMAAEEIENPSIFSNAKEYILVF